MSEFDLYGALESSKIRDTLYLSRDGKGYIVIYLANGNAIVMGRYKDSIGCTLVKKYSRLMGAYNSALRKFRRDRRKMNYCS